MTKDQEAILALTRRLDAIRDVRRQLAELEHCHVLSTPEQAYRDAWRRLNAAIEGTDPLAQEARGACDHQVKWLYAASGNVYVCSACGDEMPITAAEARKLPYDPALNASPERGTGGDTLADRLYAIGRHVGWDRDGLEHIAVQIFAVADELSGKPTTLHNATKEVP
jgi:hypothetical protein